MMTARPDALWAVAVGGAAFAVYLRTLAPGLVAVVDTPMFQFIGRVLGVPHNPGYPLYVLLTYPFSYLPIGSLAYRINLFSAMFGALTVSLAFLIARRLGCRRIVSAAAALGMAFGHIFWSQSLIAEVYTLDSAIIAGMLLALLAWGQTGRPGYFFTSTALFAAGLGNHTTIVGFAPGMALYAVLKDRQFVLRARTLAITTLILFAGVLQYGFIIVRSRQPGTYLESRATTVRELVGVMSGQQFGDRLFAFEWRTVVFDRLPWLIGRVLAPELTIPGLALALVGAAWLLRRRFPEGLLILLGGLAVMAFALNYSVTDTPVFLIPTTLVLWVAVAVGAEQATQMVERRPRAAMAVAAAMLALPGWHLARNFTVTDRSRDTAAAVTFDRLFDALPDKSVFVREDFLVDRMVMFKLLGDRSAGTRQIELAARNANVLRKRHEAGFGVFGFQKSVRRLRYDALNFDFAPVTLKDGPLGDFLSRLPDGAVVAVAVPVAHAERFAAVQGISFTAIGGPDGFSERTRANLAIVGVRGARGEALVNESTADLLVHIGGGQPIGGTRVSLQSAVEARANATEAAIRQGSRDLVRSHEGAVMAVWNEDGSLGQTFVMQAADDFRVPIPSSPLFVYPLRGVWDSQELSAEDWSDVLSSTQTGSTMLKLPAGAAVVMYLGSVAPLAPRVIDRSSSRLSEEITSFHGTDRAALRAKLQADGLKSGALEQTTYVYRIAVGAPRADSVSALTALGGVPTLAVGRVVQGRASRATVFRIDTMGLLRTPDRSSEVLLMTRDDQSQLIGEGWSAVDWDPVSAYRWMTRTEARLLLPIAKPDARRVRIQALLEEGGAPRSVGLRINGVELAQQSLRSGWNTYEWTLPPGATKTPVHDVVITIDHLSPSKGKTPARGIAVTELRVIHGP
jgi:Protein of unknown function (DUF2723)